MELIAITLPWFYPSEGADIARKLRSGQYSRIHIRKPGADEQEVRKLMDEIPADLRRRISLHDCHSIAAETGAGGIHLNRRNPDIPPGWDGLVSVSLHSPAEAEALGGRADYAFLSPVFPSVSKPGYGAERFDPSELRKTLRPGIYALGGVTPDRLPELEAMGFHGAAMLGAAWRREIDPEAFRLQLITDGTDIKDVLSGARMSAEGGCRWVQIRMKGAPVESVAEVARELAPLRESHGIVLLVDDHVELAAQIDCIDGVHVGKNDMPVAEARRLLGPGKILGATANTIADIEAALRDGADYIGLGPYRFTTTKKNLSPVLGTEGYRDILGECRRRDYRQPVVAIGGITASDIPGIMSAGAAGIAVSGAILRQADPAEAARRMTEILKTNTNT